MGKGRGRIGSAILYPSLQGRKSRHSKGGSRRRLGEVRLSQNDEVLVVKDMGRSAFDIVSFERGKI